MNNHGSQESTEPVKRSRRAMLAGAAGALGVLGAETLVRATPAQAGTDGDVVLGAYNVSSAVTYIRNSGGSNGEALNVVGNGTGSGVIGNGGGSSGSGVYGFGGSPNGQGVTGSGNGIGAGVAGYNSSASGAGVYGASNVGGVGVKGAAYGTGGVGVQGSVDQPSGIGVFGQTTDTTTETYGVEGRTQGSLGRGVFGWSLSSTGGTGLWGQSNSGNGVGVRGYAWDNGTGNFGTGVMGTSGNTAFPPPGPLVNTGLYGVAVSPTGGAAPAAVVGDSTTSAAVAGFTSASSHAAGEFTHTSGGTGLAVQGAAQFSLSGVVSIVAGQKSATVNGVSLRTASLVLATVQNNCGVYVKYATPNVAGSSISINLSKVVPLGKTAQVAWFVVN
jgi:hypothetical protein